MRFNYSIKDNFSSIKGICTMKGFKLTCEPIIFLYAFIFAINYTSLPQLVLEKVCLQENHANQTECKHPEKLPDSLQEVICLFSSSTLMFRYGHLTVANWCRKSIGPNFSRKKDDSWHFIGKEAIGWCYWYFIGMEAIG